jgi:mRNA-degrading endonuclease RelE of RelBE toxin-antitoxin system
MKTLMTPDAAQEFRKLQDEDRNHVAETLVALNRIADGHWDYPTELISWLPDSDAGIYVLRSGPVRAFFTTTDDALVILGVTTKKSPFNIISRLVGRKDKNTN